MQPDSGHVARQLMHENSHQEGKGKKPRGGYPASLRHRKGASQPGTRSPRSLSASRPELQSSSDIRPLVPVWNVLSRFWAYLGCLQAAWNTVRHLSQNFISQKGMQGSDCGCGLFDTHYKCSFLKHALHNDVQLLCNPVS